MHRRVLTSAVIALLASAGLAGCAGEAQPLLVGRAAEAAAFVSGARYPGLALEIDYVAGARPDPRSIEFVLSELWNVTTKRSINVIGPTEEAVSSTPLAQEREWDDASVLAAHEAMLDSTPLDTNVIDGTAYLHVMFLGGTYTTKGRDAAGVSAGPYLAVFVEPPGIEQMPLYTEDSFREERAILLHEIGHSLGLVDSGAPVTFDRVAEDGIHSTNPESVMSYAVEYRVDSNLLVALPERPDTFDQYDLADLAALRDLAERDAARRR